MPAAFLDAQDQAEDEVEQDGVAVDARPVATGFDLRNLAALQQRLHRWIAGNAEAQVLRWLLRVLLIATISVLALDLSAMTGFKPESLWREVTEQPVLPDMPPVTIDEPANPQPGRRVVPARKADGALAKPMTFSLGKNGRLIATGMIAPGSAEAFAAEVNARGEYIKTVLLKASRSVFH